MASKGRLASSRKFAKGKVHETATGQFSVLDRYLDEKGTTMLSIQWITGHKQGTVDESLESTINSLIFKFNASRGLPQWAEAEKEEQPQLVEQVSDTLTVILELKEMMGKLQDELKDLKEQKEKDDK